MTFSFEKYSTEWVDDLADRVARDRYVKTDLSADTRKILEADENEVLFRMARGFVVEFVRQQREEVLHVNLEDRPFKTAEDVEEAEKQGRPSLFQVKACMKKLADMGVPQEDNFKIVSAILYIAINRFAKKADVPKITVSVRKDHALKAFADSLYENKDIAKGK